MLHAVERLALLPLVGGGLFLLLSGTANVARWYPWSFFFPRAHFWAAWITIGALVVHVGAKAAATRDARPAARRPRASGPRRPTGARSWAGSPSRPGPGGRHGRADRVGARPVSVLAQRRPASGPRACRSTSRRPRRRVTEVARDPAYRLVVEGAVDRRLELSLDDLRALPQREAELPIACVEGWSALGPVARRARPRPAGAGRAAATPRRRSSRCSAGGRYRTSELNARPGGDADTLLALELDGEPLHIDHGFPVRLIGPNRPGVLQTKWVTPLVVH